MKRGVISKSQSSGHWVLNIKLDGKTTHLKAVAKSTALAGDVMADCVKLYGLDQIGVKSSDMGPNTVLAFGPICWMKPGWPS